eukprot:scaffold92684_cov26-Tisochrysis_lutea.AAC.2
MLPCDWGAQAKALACRHEALADRVAAAGAEAAQQLCGTREALPLQLCGSPDAGKEESLLWGPDHMVSVHARVCIPRVISWP